jgi:hypothetical protein
VLQEEEAVLALQKKKKQILDGFFPDGFKNRLELNFYRLFFENRP